MHIYNIMILLQGTPGNLDRIAIIRKYKDTLQTALYYTYTPFKRYHIRRIPEKLQGQGTGRINSRTYGLLDRLVDRQLTGDQARAAIFNYIETLTFKDGEVLKSIIRKTWAANINTKLINTAYGYELIEHLKVMLATRYSKVTPAWPMLATIKLDGIRAVYKQGDFFTRNGHKILGLEHISTFLRFHGDFHLDGELYSDVLPFDKLSGIVRSNKDKSSIRYIVFDTRHDFKLPQIERLRFIAQLPRLGTGFVVEHLPYIKVRSENEAFQCYRAAIKRGYEGLVLKEIYAPYIGKRSNYWLKIKPLHSGEYKIVGYFKGEGKYGHTLGGFELRFSKDTIGRVGSGFSDTERDKIWADPDKYIGKWATIEFMERSLNGRLRHPIYKTTRWDI